MSRGNRSAGKRRREAERERKKREKRERARERRAASGGGIEIASVEDIQTAAVNTTVESVRADGTVLTDENDVEAGASGGTPCRLFVGGLSWDTEVKDLRAVFTKVGEVIDAIIVTDRDTGDSRGFGFVTMADHRDAAKAVRELGGFELDGRNIRVDIATDRQ